jgi:LruC domain-containing protein
MKNYVAALILTGALASCSTPQNIQTPTPTQKPFAFETTQSVSLEVSAFALGGPVKGAPVTVFQSFNSDGTVNESTSILNGVIGADGSFRTTAVLPSDLKAIGVRVQYIGVISEPIIVPIQNGKAVLKLDGQSVSTATLGASSVVVPKTQIKTQNLTAQAINYTYKYLGGFGNWNNLGVPTNLLSNSSKVTADMLQTINATLPENSPLPTNTKHSTYLSNTATSNLVLQQDAEIYLTFVHEGAGYKNSVGYYLYDAANPPSSVNDIKSRMILAYPNNSYLNSGGGLQSGNRVKLRYLDPVTGLYSDTFPAGTGVGWFLAANGWRDSATGVLERAYEQTSFSDPVLNYQTYNSQGMTVAQSAQTVLLLDENHQTLLLGFEDILRHHGGDQDFNDAVLLVETNLAAVKTTGIVVRDPVSPEITRTADLQPVDDPAAADSDGDGISNPFDAYPNDPSKAFNNYFPAKGDYGTLVFEDLWPKRGDYDFNDTVVDYNINQVSNANNQLVEIQSEYVLRALGGGYHNGFGISSNLTPAQISEVTTTWEKNGVLQTGAPPVHYTTRQANGLEAGQAKAVAIAWDDGYDVLPVSVITRPYYSNVAPNETYQTPGRVKITMKLTNPVAMSAPGAAPYNPFLIVNGKTFGRSTEVHLAGQAPTSLGRTDYFGTEDDTSNSSTGRYFVDSTARPFAMNIPTQFTYLQEILNEQNGWVSLGQDIRGAYLKFDSWTTSNGTTNKDWYRDLAGYRDNSKLFIRP